MLDHSLPGVHGTLLVGVSVVLRYSYSVGLLIAAVLAEGMYSCAKPPVYMYLQNLISGLPYIVRSAIGMSH